MRTPAILFASAVALVLAFAANAGPAASKPIPLPPKPNFAPMRYLIGTWSCYAKNARRPVPSFGAIVYSVDPGGYFINMRVIHQGTPWYPHEHFGTVRMTYDADASRWITIGTESDGGYAVADSAGWIGMRLVWHDITPRAKGDSPPDGDYTITKVSHAKYLSAWSVTSADGHVIRVMGACSRRA